MRVVTRLRGLSLAALLGVAVLCSACDVKTDVTIQPEASAKAEERVAVLEAELERERARTAELEASLASERDTSVVAAGEKRVTFHINTPASLVLIFSVLALAAVLITRIRHGGSDSDDYPSPK